MEKRTLTVREAAQILGIGTTRAYECVRAGRIPSIRWGRKYLVPRQALEAMIERETRWADNGDGNLQASEASAPAPDSQQGDFR